MNIPILNRNRIQKGFLAGLMLSLMAGFVSNASHAELSQKPLFITTDVPPIVMLTMGRDHKLFYEAYNDASDLNGDGLIDIGYKPDIDYYGYFNSHRCYDYVSSDGGYFEPKDATLDKTCSSVAGAWSGDFLNYITTARIDALRKVLYGGYRSTDTTSSTILKRSLIPQDAHSWGKEYNPATNPGYAISDYTPLSEPASGTSHLFANVSLSYDGQPLMRVLNDSQYRIWEWVSIERPVAGAYCINGSVTTNPCAKGSSKIKDYSVNVKVCETDKLEINCKPYSNGSTTTYKPIGLLQTYGDNDAMAFGLLTGSYKKNISGGVLRKNIESFKNEVDPNTGIFTSTNGIVSTLNKLRINTFNFSSHAYASGWITNRPIKEGEAAEWGNPIAEMMYESLRYFAGKASPTSAFSISSSDTPDATLGLPLPDWLDPYKSKANSGGGFLSCAKPIELVISDINPSYDTDQLPGSSFCLDGSTGAVCEPNNSFIGDLSGLNVSDLADTIWKNESEAATVFIGQSGTVSDGAPTAKSVTSFKNIRGLAPEEPTKLGGFYAGSVALHGSRTDLNEKATGDQKTNTLAVALASPLPQIKIPVKGQTITLVPFAKSVRGVTGLEIDSTSNFQPTNQIVDFYVEKIVNTTEKNKDSSINEGRPYGKFRINYEDVEQAADHDMDAIVEYTFSVNTSNQLEITLNSTYAYGGLTQHMGYVISGTSKDGIYLEVRDQLGGEDGPDTDYFLDTPPGQPPGGVWKDGVALPFSTTRTFNVGSTTSASYIHHDPLWYAAKWGAVDINENGILDLNEWDNENDIHDGIPDSYFLVTNAGKLPEQLSKAFAKAISATSSASAVAANSTQLNTGTQVYQAKFDPSDWSGKIQTFSVDTATGVLTETWEASNCFKAACPPATTPMTHDARKIYTYDPSAEAGSRGIPFKWNNLTTLPSGTSQQDYLNALNGNNDSQGELRLNWLRGDTSHEKTTENPDGFFRPRTNFLGDIVNSDPFYVGNEDQGYGTLAGAEGSSYTAFRASTTYTSRRPMLYVGANDGMLHGFDASSTGGQEIFAYIPNALFPELSKLTSPSYTHQYYVDGAPTAGDVYDGSAWHTVLAGTTGAGGRAVFALDVTNPDSFGAASTLWEFTNADDADLGYTLAQPSVVRMEDGHWAVIVANGYNSENGHAVLFVLDAMSGAVLQKIDTGIGDATNKNGLSNPLAVDTNNDRSVDTVYAGDLYGNLWKFNLSGSAGSWPTPSSPFFVACTTSGISCSTANRQPITAKPNVGKPGTTDQGGTGTMVYFGTGKYFETNDNIVGSDPQIQTFYGLWDQGSNITDRANLQEQSIDFEGFATTACAPTYPTYPICPKTSKPIRVASKNPVCYAASSTGCSEASSLKNGWALNLLKPANLLLTPSENNNKGERVISYPLLRRGLVVFATVIPNPDACEAGGQSKLMEVDALTGGEFASPPFDVNGDGVVNSADLVIIDGVAHAAAGIDQDIGISKTPAVIESKDVDYKYSSGSTGAMGTVTDAGAGGGPGGIRRSWQQLK